MIEGEQIKKLLAAALQNGGDLAEVFVENRQGLSMHLDDGKLESTTQGNDQGVGVRVFYGDTAAYAYTDDLAEDALLETARAAAAAAKGKGPSPTAIDLTRKKSPLDFPVKKAFDSVPLTGKADMLRQIDATARGYSPYVKQVQSGYGELHQQVWIYNSDGLWTEDERNVVEFRTVVTTQKDGLLQRASAGFGGQMGMELLDGISPKSHALEVAESAVRMLDSRPAPAGEMAVVITNGWGGVLFHEACGHAMEADFVTKGSSAYAGKVGQQVASPLVTAIDDGTIPGRRGSFRFDDEGTPSSHTVLIEKGILREYMWDLAEARRMKRQSTGNGRRWNFRCIPMPRMTNTYIDRGESDPEEIVRSVKKGLFVKRLGGGSADIARGDFVFSVTEGYLIEDGKITAPVRGATLVGNGPQVLLKIDMVGNDLSLDDGMGMCGKGQDARVSVGQPTLRVPLLTVGGTDRS